MKRQPKQLSIIIPTWNTADITHRCVKSILKFLPKNFTEIIVVDNGSTDNTEKLFKNLKAIVYIRNSANLGFSKACNIGAGKAIGENFLFLNSDMELIDNKLLEMFEFFKHTVDCGIIGPKFLNPDYSIQGSVFPDQSVVNAFREYWLGSKSYSKYAPVGEKPTKVWAISGGAILISRELFDKIGGWDEKYFMFYEDLALCKSVRNLGKAVYYYPCFKLIHHHGQSGKNLADSLNQWRRLIPSSKTYHGLFHYYLLYFITWTSQKWKNIFGKKLNP